MIEDIDDQRRGSMGQHHGSRRDAASDLTIAALGVRRILVVADRRSGAPLDVAGHLARSMQSSILIADLTETGCSSNPIVAGVESEALLAPTPSDLVHAALLSDLVVVGREDADDTRRIADLARASSCPILQIPASPANRRPGQHVLVLWDGSSQAARLLRDCRPLLRDACAVAIIDSRRSDEAPAASHAVAYLQRHGFTAAASARLARSLPDLVGTYAPDLLVMAVGAAPMFSRSETFDDCTVVLSNG